MGNNSKILRGKNFSFIPDTKKISILLADDEPEILYSLEEILVFNGFDNIDMAENGEEAIEKISKKNYDIVITDIAMPGKNGYEVVNFVVKNCPTTVPIIMTGYIDTDTAIKSFQVGAYDFLKKPFNREMIILTLERALAKRAVILAEENYKKMLEEEVERRTEKIRELNRKILKLYELSQNAKETLELGEAITIFKEHSVEFFKPENFAILLYSSISDILVIHNEFYSKNGKKPKRMSYSTKEFIITQTKQLKNAIFLFPDDNYSIIVRLTRHNNFLGFLYMGFKDEKQLFTVDDKLLELFVSELEAALYRNRLIEEHNERMKQMVLNAVKTHAYSIEAKDPYTRGHCDRVEIYSSIIARRLIKDENELFNFKIACILHDIGKIGIPDSLIKKPDKLTKEEYEEMKKHPVIGANIAKPLYGEKIARIIRHHHEWYDGSGYPDGLKGDEIPLESRIMIIGDTYDAMTSTRPYRKAKSHEEAYNEIIKYSGRQFDPELVNIFIEVYDEIKSVEIEEISVDITI